MRISDWSSDVCSSDLSYRLPLAGKSSILHRVSGALLFLCIPIVILPLFALSVTSAESFASIQAWMANPLCKLVLLALIWGFLHHFCAGIRYLVLDLHIGNDKHTAQKTAGRSEEHTSELQSLMRISYAVFCLK